MSSHRADSTPGNRKKQQIVFYCIGAGIGLQCVLRLLDILPSSMPHAWTAAGMAGLIGGTTGVALFGYGLWWVGFRKSTHMSPGNASLFVVYCRQCRRAIEFSQAMCGYKKKCPSCGTKQTMPSPLDPSVIPLAKQGDDSSNL
jgi:hypothetical protein